MALLLDPGNPLIYMALVLAGIGIIAFMLWDRLAPAMEALQRRLS